MRRTNAEHSTLGLRLRAPWDNAVTGAATGTISTTITSTVTIGPGGYPRVLTITGTGQIAPSAYGAPGIYIESGLKGVSILNQGTISGGEGSFSANAGVGVDLASRGKLTNDGSIAGGAGVGSGDGGVGVELAAGGSLTNTGIIAGGRSALGVAGDGVDVASGGNLSNSGAISGGAGYYGGVGVDLTTGGSLTNTGTIAGGVGGTELISGRGGGDGGIGADLAGGTLINHGIIAGGNGDQGADGGVGVYCGSGGRVANDGTILGGSGGYYYGAGGEGAAGVHLASRTALTNDGWIAGGKGGSVNYLGGTEGEGGNGGTGVLLGLAAILTNTGTISGGGDGSGSVYGIDGIGGSGVAGNKSATLLNRGTILGGYGEGVGGRLTNTGGIIGGAGNSFYSSKGGAGIVLGHDGRLANSGIIAGGAGYRAGGIGVDLPSGGTVTNSGTISGGAVSNGTTADALSFGGKGTLTVDPGAVFNGLVVGDAAVNDLLVLAGTSAGTLDSLGSEFTGFRTVSVAAHANWTLTGAGDLGAHVLLDAGGLNVASGNFGGGAATIARTGLLQAGGTSVVHFGRVTLAGGTLACGGAAGVVVGGLHANEQVSKIVVQAGAIIAGFGTISGAAVLDAGTIDAVGGRLTLATSVSGPGTIAISAQSVLQADAGAAAAMTLLAGGGGTLALGAPMQATGTISGLAAGDTIDLLHLRATGFSFSTTTDILTVSGSSGTIAALHFAGSYTTASFAKAGDHNGGTFITPT